MRRLCAVLVVLFAHSASAAPNLETEVTALMQRELERTGIPSLQVAVGLGGSVIFSAAVGYADLENKVTASAKTRYRTASVSKWMTSSAALALAATGKLDLDARAQDYCPAFPEKSFPISTRQLLTHTAGVRHYLDYDGMIEAATSEAQREAIERRRDRDLLAMVTRYTEMQLPLALFEDDPLLFEPGSDWLYSSPGYRLVGCILEGAAAKDYNTLIEQRVLQPAGMTSTVPDDAWAIVPHRAAGYRLSRDKSLRRADLRDVSENLPAGGHLSTAEDLVRLALAVNEAKLYPTTIRDLVMRPHPEATGELPERAAWRDAIPSRYRYGYGTMFFPSVPGTWLGHSGRQAGGSAIVMLNPEEGYAFAIMTNAKGWNGFISLSRAIAALIAAD